MKNSHTFYLAIIGLLALALLTRGSGKVTHKQDVYNTYETDTTFSKKVYKDIVSRIDGLEKKLEETPPREIIYYPSDPEEMIIEKIPDSILVYIGELEEKVAISDDYIKNFPRAHKLVDFRMTREKLDITTVALDGQVSQRNYPLALNEYDYYWANNSLKHIDSDSPYKETKWGGLKDLYLNIGYEFLQGAPLLGVDYQLKYNGFKLSTQASSIINPEGIKLRGDIKLGYRLFK